MWHEVRKQEKKIRCMIVDYKRRAERRKDYYEKIKADPTQFLQVHGRPCKIHLDPAIAAAGDSSAVMMHWAGCPDVIIDRFDVRAHLDMISENKGSEVDSHLSYDERYINYERYRILVQNDFLGVPEEKFLQQLYLEEQYGASTKTGFVPIEGKKKVPGAAIGYNYDDPGSVPSGSVEPSSSSDLTEDKEDVHDDDDSDLDFDVCVDVNQVTTQQAHELNHSSHSYGMEGNDFFSFLTKDKEEADNLRIAKELEEEKAMYSGRKSRRERRAYREKKLAGRKISPPSYASRKSPSYLDYKRQLRSASKSRSPSPENSGQITYITSFGEEEHGSEMSGKKRHLSSMQQKSAVTRKSSSLRYSQMVQGGPQSSRSHSSYNHSSRSPNYVSRQHACRSPQIYRRCSRSPGKTRRSPRRGYSPSPVRYRSRAAHEDRYHPSRSPRRQSRSPRHRHHSQPSPPPRHKLRRSPSLEGFKSMSRSPHNSPSPPKEFFTGPRNWSQDLSNDGSTKNIASGNTSPSKQNSGIPRYYGRRKDREKSSSSEISWSGNDDDQSNSSSTIKNSSEKLAASEIGNSGGRTKVGSGGAADKTRSLQERLKRKMQIMLNRQFKADKRAEKEKQERVEQERIDREDEMRELSIKLRKRERMKRHEYYAELERRGRKSRSKSSSSDRSHSSPKRSPSHRRERRKRTRSRSRSNSSERNRSRGLVDY